MNGFLARRPGWWRLMIVGVIILIACLYVSPVRAFVEKSNLIQSEKAKTESLRSERDRLQFEKDSLQNNSYVEQVARRDLGMVKPGEQPYVVKDLNTTEEPPAPEAQPAEDPSAIDRAMESLDSLIH